MSDSAFIRPIELKDLNEVLLIERQSFFDPWPLEWFRTILRWKDHFQGLFVDDLGLLGYAISSIEDDQLHITNLAVHPDHLRKGYGRILVQEALDYADKSHLETSFLEVRQENIAAIRLYESLGFCFSRIEQDYYGEGENALILVRTKNGVV